jgi:hypothetical protein
VSVNADGENNEIGDGQVRCSSSRSMQHDRERCGACAEQKRERDAETEDEPDDAHDALSSRAFARASSLLSSASSRSTRESACHASTPSRIDVCADFGT